MSTRRNMLKLMLGGAAACVGASESPLSLRFRMPQARAAGNGKTLIKVFLRGGADGLNLFPPYAENRYYSLRPNIAVAPPNGSDSNAALHLTNHFGLHPALAPLKEIWDAGHMALMPATHLEGAKRSHFDNQAWFERGFIGTGFDGYFARYLRENRQSVPFQAMAAGTNTTQASLVGAGPVTAIRQISDFSIKDYLWCSGENCSENGYHQMLNRLYAENPVAASAIEALAYENGRDLADKLILIASLNENYTPSAGGLEYSGSELGNGLATTAQLLKADVGLEVVAINWSIGWDTHSNQLPNGTSHGNMSHPYHNKINDGANNILTFYRDIAEKRGDVMMIFGTEFGRTAKENGSRGTDHGNASAWFAIGGGLNSGVHGEWPGLDEGKLHHDRYLSQSIDYRDIMSEAIVRVLGAPEAQLSTIFPNFTPTNFNIFQSASV